MARNGAAKISSVGPVARNAITCQCSLIEGTIEVRLAGEASHAIRAGEAGGMTRRTGDIPVFVVPSNARTHVRTVEYAVVASIAAAAVSGR